MIFAKLSNASPTYIECNPFSIHYKRTSLKEIQLFCGIHKIDLPDMSAHCTTSGGYVHKIHITLEHPFRVDIFVVMCISCKN